MSPVNLTRIVTTSLFVSVVGGSWDAWWHGALGRESFWSPPHLLLYAAVITAIACGVYGWYTTREVIWRRLAVFLVLVPLSAPFDEIWHRIFGVESISSPLIVWSPPHLVLIGAILGSFLMLLPLILRDNDLSARRFFSALVFGACLMLLFFLTSPVFPTGPHMLVGFYGAGIISFVLALVLLSARARISGIAAATLTVLVFLFLLTIEFGEKLASNVVIKPHDHAPPWLVLFSFMVPAVFTDLVSRLPVWLKGAVIGVLHAAIFYCFASYFFASQFKYGFEDAIIAVVSGLFGGLVAGAFVHILFRDSTRGA